MFCSRAVRPAREILAGLLLCGLVWLAFGRTVANGYLEWDDRVFVSGSPAVTHGLSWAGIRWAFEANLTRADTTVEYWIPLTAVSRLIDAEFFGMAPGWVHGMSVVYHTLAALALLAALRGFGVSAGRAWLVAALFAVHPLQVEAVSWASGRKDVLGGLFWALILWAYAAYVRRQTRWRYFLVLLAFACGLMAKPSVLALPAALLLLDHWPLGRFAREPTMRLIAEKVPLALLAGISLLTSVLAQQDHGGMKSLEMYPLWVRIGNAAMAYADYLRTFVWPAGLSPVYPHPGLDLPVARAVVSAILVGGLTLAAVRCTRRAPWFFTGWFWYVCTLVPMIGLIQLGGAARADRYLYSAIIGLCWIVVEGGAALLGRCADARFARRAGLALGGAACLVLAALSYRQSGLWRDTIPLFEHAVRVTDRNRQAHLSLGIAWLARGDLARARAELERSLSIIDTNPLTWGVLGKLGLQERKPAEALYCFEAVTQLNPNDAGGHYHVGYTRALLGDRAGAERAYLRAAELRPEWARPLLQVAGLREQAGDAAGARHFRELAGARPIGPGQPEGGP
jgi:hypothetical protein